MFIFWQKKAFSSCFTEWHFHLFHYLINWSFSCSPICKNSSICLSYSVYKCLNILTRRARNASYTNLHTSLHTHTHWLAVELPSCLLYVTKRTNRDRRTLSMPCCLDTRLCLCCIPCNSHQRCVFVSGGGVIASFFSAFAAKTHLKARVCACHSVPLPSLFKKSSITHSLPASSASTVQ